MSWQEMDRVSQGMIDGCADDVGDSEVQTRCQDCVASMDLHIDKMTRHCAIRLITRFCQFK